MGQVQISVCFLVLLFIQHIEKIYQMEAVNTRELNMLCQVQYV